MKTNKFLLFSLAAAMMAGCADDGFTNESGMNGGDEMGGKLVKAGLLGVGRDGNDAGTRAYNPNGDFVWMPGELTDDGKLTDARLNQRIGLCWTGVDEGGFGAVKTADQKVYTNYEYEHVGWLDKLATSPMPDPCDEAKLLNGAFIKGEGTPEAKFGSGWNTGGRWNAYYYDYTKGTYSSDSEWASEKGEYSGSLDLGRGVFSTKNASVFQGEYLAYYPYTNDFKKGQIVAHEPTTFNVDETQDRYAAAWDKAFSIGYIKNYEGGSAASGIAGKTLSGFLIAKLYNYKSGAKPDDRNIKTVVFYSEGDGILYKQDLNAKACVDALKAGDLGNGQDLYYNNGAIFHKRTNAVVANLHNGNDKNYFEVEGTNNKPATATATYYSWVALPVLPQNISDLKVILIDDQDKSCTLEMESGAVKPNEALIKEINLADCDFVNEYLAVDEASFLSAMSKIKTSGNVGTTRDANRIKLLKDITMTFNDEDPALTDYVGVNKYTGMHNSLFFNRNIRVYSACGARLTVAADTYMNIKNLASEVNGSEEPVLTIDVPVIVEGAGCCASNPALLSVGGAQKVDQACHVVFGEDVQNYGLLALGNNADGSSVVEIEGTLSNKFDNYAIKRNKTQNAALVYLVGGETSGASEIHVNTLENEGEVISMASAVDVNTYPTVNEFASGNTTATERVVRTYVGTLTNDVTENEPAGIVENSGQIYIDGLTELYVDNLTNVNKASLIKTSNLIEGEAKSLQDGRLTVRVAATNNGILDNSGVTNLEKQPMKNNGLVIDQLSGQLGGYYVENGEGNGKSMTYEGVTYATDLNVGGIYVSKVATAERFKFALTDAVEEPSCNIIEIVAQEDYFYNLAMLDEAGKLGDKDVYVSCKNACFKAYGTDGQAIAKNFGHCVTVRTNASLNVKEGLLSTKKDVTVETGGEFGTNKGSESKITTEVTINGNLNNNGKTTNNGVILAVVKDLTNATSSAEFISNGTFKVDGNITTSGDFDSDGDNNTVGGNFIQTGGDVAFACKTTTNISGEFSCEAGKFTREALGTNGSYRATVNVGSLGDLLGTNNGGWPTVIKQ